MVQSQPSNDREIGIHETFTEYANRCYAKNEFCITEDRTDVRTLQRPVKTIQDEQGLDIAFHRTTRLPDDNKLHHLPQSLGCYDLFNVAEYAGRLPQNIRDAGGVFFPMFQREAMWISFSLRTDYPEARYAVRVFVGRVNAVSGQLMDEEPTQDGGERKQDYIVIPGQKWLDGICVAPGVVRQFVAMPRKSTRPSVFASGLIRHSGLWIHHRRPKDVRGKVWRASD